MENKKIAAGKKAPDFCLTNAHGNEICLSDFNGQWVVLYFYPKDNTPGCTAEALDFSAMKKEFKKHNAFILGISKDTCASHRKFIEKHSLTILLLSDEDTKVQNNYGVWRKKKFMGREFLGTVRTTVLINPDGIIRRIWDKVKVKGHAAEVLEELKNA